MTWLFVKDVIVEGTRSTSEQEDGEQWAGAVSFYTIAICTAFMINPRFTGNTVAWRRQRNVSGSGYTFLRKCSRIMDLRTLLWYGTADIHFDDRINYC